MNSLRERWSHLLSFTRQFAAAAPRQFAIAGILAVVLGLTEGITTLLLIPLLDATGVNVSQGSLGRLSEYVQRAFAIVHLRPTLGTALTPATFTPPGGVDPAENPQACYGVFHAIGDSGSAR